MIYIIILSLTFAFVDTFTIYLGSGMFG